MDKSSESCLCPFLPQIQNARERLGCVTCLSLTREGIAPSRTIPVRLHVDLGAEIPHRDIRAILFLEEQNKTPESMPGSTKEGRPHLEWAAECVFQQEPSLPVPLPG